MPQIGKVFVGLSCLVALLLSFVCAPAHCGELAGQVGVHKFVYQTRTVNHTEAFSVPADQAEFIAITEVYPESTKPVFYHYLVTAPGIAPFERLYAAKGFGPVTYFLRVTRQPVGEIKFAKLGKDGNAPHILGVRAVTRDELARVKGDDHFKLLGTMLNPRNVMPEVEQANRLAARLPVDPSRNIGRSFSAEIYYAARDSNNVRQQIEFVREQSLKHGMPALVFFDSWWAGTPRNVPDGQGGTFGDLKYQQICYTPNYEHPVDEKLKKFLGDRYSSHYCLSIPNQWSSTPWLTMNSPEYNAYRARRLREAVDSLKEISRGDTSWIMAVGLENEPRYWDTQAAAGLKPPTGERWADFNPQAVAAAARDGVKLNPADGMSLEELNWLQRNISRYFQETVDVFRAALAERGLLDRFPVYTHTLQLAQLFPGNKINQTAADWALARGAHAGLEGMWTQPSDFDRVREWGSWCNLNREETDGNPIDTHLWDLRTAYAMGGEFYNSFNWHLIKQDAYFNYARQFLTSLPVVTLPPVRAALTNAYSLTFTPPGGLQAFSQITVPVENISATPVKGLTVALLVDGGAKRVWFSERQPLAAGRQLLKFDFPAFPEVNWRATGVMHLQACDASGAVVRKAVAFAGDAAQELRLSCDLEQSRALSQLVMRWKQGAPNN